MSSSERERGLWPSVPRFAPASSSDRGKDDVSQQEHEIILPLSNSTPLPERAAEHSFPRIGSRSAATSPQNRPADSMPSPEFWEDPRVSTPRLVPTSSSEFAGQYQAAQPVATPTASSISSLEGPSERSESTPLSERAEEHLLSRMITEKAAPAGNISSPETGEVRWVSTPRLGPPFSLELGVNYQASQPIVSPISSSMVSQERGKERILPSSASEILEADSMSSPKGGGERWAFTPRLVPPSSLEYAGPYKAAQPVTPRCDSMSTPEITRDRILSRVGSATTARSTSRIPSKVNTGGRIRLDKGEGSARFLQDLALNVGEDLGSNTPGKQERREESTGKSEKLTFGTSEDIPLVPRVMPVSPPRSVVSRENERPVRTYREVQGNFQSWDGMKNIGREVWISFMNWNNRRTLKRIKASLHVLRTYHDAILHGEVPLNLQARTRIRAGWIGFLWHIMEFLLGVISAALYVYST